MALLHKGRGKAHSAQGTLVTPFRPGIAPALIHQQLSVGEGMEEGGQVGRAGYVNLRYRF